MSKENQKRNRHITLLAIGSIILGLAGCTYVYPPEAQSGQYHANGFYSYEDYPDTYVYYDAYGRPYRSGYSDDPNLRYDARNQAPFHADDHNFHNRDDFDHWDY